MLVLLNVLFTFFCLVADWNSATPFGTLPLRLSEDRIKTVQSAGSEQMALAGYRLAALLKNIVRVLELYGETGRLRRRPRSHSAPPAPADVIMWTRSHIMWTPNHIATLTVLSQCEDTVPGAFSDWVWKRGGKFSRRDIFIHRIDLAINFCDLSCRLFLSLSECIW